MKEIGVALVINDKLEENLKWAKNAGFANCQLQIWDMGLLYEEHARQIKKLTDTYAMEITGNFFCDLVTSLRMIPSRPIHLPKNFINSLFLKSE